MNVSFYAIHTGDRMEKSCATKSGTRRTRDRITPPFFSWAITYTSFLTALCEIFLVICEKSWLAPEKLLGHMWELLKTYVM